MAAPHWQKYIFITPRIKINLHLYKIKILLLRKKIIKKYIKNIFYNVSITRPRR